MYTAIRRAFVLAAAVFSSSAFGDYVANRIDYVDPTNGTVANFTQLWSINNKGTALGAASFDGGLTAFSFVYDPATANYVRLPLPPGFDGITTFANPTGINDAGVMTGATFEPTGSRGFILKDGVFTFFSIPGWPETSARTIGNPTAAHPDGLVVGFVDDVDLSSNTLLSSAAFMYDPATAASATINVVDSFLTIMHGQNALGQIVGNIFADGSSRAFGRWGFMFAPTTGNDPMLGGTVSYFRINDMPTSARGINDTGLIAAAVQDVTGSTQTYVGTSGSFQLVNVPGSTGPACPDNFFLPGTFPEHITNAGQVFGFATDSACNTHGFTATPASLPTATTGTGAHAFSVDIAASEPIFISAPTAIAYDYALGQHDDPRFASVRLPLGLGSNKFIVAVGHKTFAVNAGQLFDFREHGFKTGVKTFRVACIDPAARLDPVNSLAFPTELTFVEAGKFTGTQQPLITATGDDDRNGGAMSQSECRQQLLSRQDDGADD